MDGLEFTSSVIRSLAWPTAVVTLALVFRTTLAAALSGRLKRLKAGPVELEWWDYVASVVRSEVAPADTETETEGPSAIGVEDRQRDLEQLARITPGAVVLRSFAEVERELRDLIVPVAPEAANRFGAHGIALIAADHGLISAATVKAVEGISVMRNLAAHGGDNQLSAEQAMEYAALAGAVLYAIRQEAAGRDQPS